MFIFFHNYKYIVINMEQSPKIEQSLTPSKQSTSITCLEEAKSINVIIIIYHTFQESPFSKASNFSLVRDDELISSISFNSRLDSYNLIGDSVS